MLSPRRLARLPPSTLLVVLATLARLASGHVVQQLPVETITVAYRLIDAAPYPPLPTQAPLPLGLITALRGGRDLRRRQQPFNTVCGFIGGDPLLPATCSAGSHCVVDQQHGAVGCCPDGGACTTGVFTGCVDFNSGPQTVVDPYVFTCAGSDVCYKNIFEGGFSQFGCGTSSGLATSVAASATGVTAPLRLSSLSVPFTESTRSLTAPVTINPSTGTRPFTQSTRTGSSSSTSSHSTRTTSTTTSSRSTTTTTTASTTTTSSSTRTTTSPALQTADPAAPMSTAPSQGTRTGAIIGGTISGVAILIALVAVGVFLCRRRSRNARQGPGLNASTAYIGPATGPRFAPLRQNQHGPDAGFAPGTTTDISGGPWRGPPQGAYAAAGGAADQVPLTRDADAYGLNDFTTSYRTALRQINEEEENPADGANTQPMNGNGYNGGGGEAGDENRPLWRQDRRRSRNMMWM